MDAQLTFESFALPYVSLIGYKGPASGILPAVTHGTITAVTHSIYSHTEIYIGGIGYSASERDGGVRQKEITFDHKWDVIPLPWVSAEDVWRFFAETDGQGYDFLGLRLFLGAKAKEMPELWWCSEWCAKAMGYLNTRISPGKLMAQSRITYMQWNYTLGA